MSSTRNSPATVRIDSSDIDLHFATLSAGSVTPAARSAGVRGDHRPHLTLAIDVQTRMVVAFHIDWPN